MILSAKCVNKFAHLTKLHTSYQSTTSNSYSDACSAK